ncbi:metallophosphoesterase [bacterium]|nr:metallophosphoesterase [bacterium]
MRFIWFFLTWTAIVALGYWYVGRRVVPALSHYSLSQPVWWLVVMILCVMPLAGFYLLLQRQEGLWLDVLLYAGYVSLGLFALLVTAFLIKDTIGLSHTLIAKLFTAGENSVDPSRRLFLTQSVNLGVAAVCSAVAGYGFYEAHRRATVEAIDIPLDKLPDEFDGFRIVQFSDLHVGPTIKRGFVERVVRQVNELKPDLIAFTGDLVDGSVSWLREDVAPLTELTAPHGVFFITGNHEYYSGAESWCKEASRLGFDVLLNEHRLINYKNRQIVLAGVTDYSASAMIPNHVSDPKRSIEDAPDNLVKILLAHQPKSVEAAHAAGFHLQLSGHTHGGQFFPGNLLAAAGQPYLKGLHRHENMWVYVNRGTGYWGPPLRLGSGPEITIITLRKA